MMGYTTKQIAQACLDYVDPMCNTHHKNRFEVLQALADLIARELSILSSSDPARNR